MSTMYDYTIFEWVAFFAIYCFIGWAGESLYVSWEHKKWVNRGFLNGPFLPIYGFGAIIMLFAALPVKRYIVLIFLFGMLAATILEYFTGWAIEKIFKVRYWDYSYEPFNLNGYICLGCSLTWGICAVILVEFIHTPVDNLVSHFGRTSLMVFDTAFLCYFIWDLAISVRQAMDLRKVIIEHLKNSQEVQRLERRADVYAAFINDDKEKFEEKMNESTAAFREEFSKLEEKFEDSKEAASSELNSLRDEISERNAKFRETIKENRSRAAKVLRRNPGASLKKKKINFERFKEITGGKD